jgi:hypothetical protein
VEGGRKARCPNCGGPIEWKLGSSAALVCPFCSFSVVRTDRDLRAIGKVADLVPTAPPIAVGDHGRIGQTGFVVGGRLQLDHGKGPWDEWYVELDDGRWAWLARAQGRWYLTFPVAASGFPPIEHMSPGANGQLPGGGDVAWTAVERGQSRLVSAEGELPFPAVPGEVGRYVDLEAVGGLFATLDYGDGTEPPRFYAGRRYEAHEIAWQEGGGPRPTEKLAVKDLRCPTCGGPVPILVPDATERAACPSCNSLLDFSAGALTFLAQLNQPKITPYVPIGHEGTLDGEKVLCIGLMERCTVVDGVTYAWREYLLHADAGYRFLLEDSNQFTLLKPTSAAEVTVHGHGAEHKGRTYRLFQTASTVVRYVVGEFYWKVEVGERGVAADYIAPPHILSEDRSEGEINWSSGRWVSGEELWKAFALPGKPPKPHDVAPAQPNPVGLGFPLAFAALAMVALVLVYFATRTSVPQAILLDMPVRFPSAPEAAMVDRGALTSSAQAATAANLALAGPSVDVQLSQPFTIPDRVDTIDVAITSDLGEGWLGLACALVNVGTNAVTEFTVEQDQFHLAGGPTVATGTSSAARIGSLTPGSYVLRVDPRWARKRGSLGETTPPSANLRVSSVNAQAEASSACCAISSAFLLLPFLLALIRRALFESRRWRNSNVV